ncbi:hypothetical protein [Limnospira platensis]
MANCTLISLSSASASDLCAANSAVNAAVILQPPSASAPPLLAPADNFQ